MSLGITALIREKQGNFQQRCCSGEVKYVDVPKYGTLDCCLDYTVEFIAQVDDDAFLEIIIFPFRASGLKVTPVSRCAAITLLSWHF